MEKCPKCRGNKTTKTGNKCPACDGVGEVSKTRFKELQNILKEIYRANHERKSDWSIV